MLKGILLITLLLVCAPCLAGINVSILGGTQVTLPQPRTITLAGDALLLKYDNWYMYQDNLNPKTVYPSIDLSGIIAAFFTAVFEPRTRKNLPAEWLSTLAKGQAQLFNIDYDEIKRWHIGEANVYAFFNEAANDGNVFIICNKSVQRIEISGSETEYRSFVQSIFRVAHVAE